MDVVLSCAELAANLLSLTSCIWLQCKFRRMDRSIKHRLFPTQLRNLVGADLMFLLPSLPGMMINHHAFFFCPVSYLQIGCSLFYTVLRVARHVGLLVEMHIALCFLLKSLRWAILHPIRRSLSFVWIIGAVLGALSVWKEPFTYNARMGLCAPINWLGGCDPVSTTMIALCMVVCTTSYVIVIARSRHQTVPHSVRNSVWKRGEMYMVNALATYTLVLCIYISEPAWNNIYLRVSAFTFENLGGFLNTLTYAMQSRYATPQTPLHASTAPGVALQPSYHVDIGGTEVVEIDPCKTARAPDQ